MNFCPFASWPRLHSIEIEGIKSFLPGEGIGFRMKQPDVGNEL